MMDVDASPASPSRPQNLLAPSNHEVPLNDPLRTTPIHPNLPDIKLPSSPHKIYQYHPVSCEPLTSHDLHAQKLQQLRKQYPTAEEARKAQEEAATDVKKRMEETEQKRREIDAELEKLERTHKLEMRVINMNKAKKEGKNEAG